MAGAPFGTHPLGDDVDLPPNAPAAYQPGARLKPQCQPFSGRCQG